MLLRPIHFLIAVISLYFTNYLVSGEKYENISGCRKIGFVFTRVLTLICAETDNANQIFSNLSPPSCDLKENAFYTRGGEVNFQNCKFIELNGTYLKYLIPFEIFNASDVELDLLLPETFENSTQLTTLILSNNNLVRIPRLVFADKMRLTQLDFSNNRIESIDSLAFEKSKNLDELDLSNNRLTRIDDQLFKNLSVLTKLNISYNRFNEIDLHILPKSLKVLDLSVNWLTKLNSCNHLVDLRYLDLSYNIITVLKVDTFANLLNLQYLNLRQMNLSHIELGTFSHQHKLVTLDLSENELKKINFKLFFPVFHDLRSLSIADNYLKDLEGFKNALFPQLVLLDIKMNLFNCSYLEYFMESVNWEKLRLSIDTKSANPLQANIRGVLCLPVDGQNIFEYNTNQNRMITLQKIVEDICIIKMFIIFICIATTMYFISLLLLNSDKIFAPLRNCRKVSPISNYVEFTNEEVINKPTNEN